MNNYAANMPGVNNGMDPISTMVATWNATQAYLQAHGHSKNIFALLSEEDADENAGEPVSYEC